jgi:hypothetical protein
MTLADVLLEANNSQDCFAKGPVYTVPAKGVTIHKIDFITAWALSTIVEPAFKAVDIPLTYGCACMLVEALGDPAAVNENIGFNSDGSPRSNEGKNDPADYDVGPFQLKLGYLMPHPMPDIDRATQFAINPRTAIPYAASLMAEKIAWAKDLIAKTPSSLALWKDPLMVATAAYNEGDEGFIKDFYTPGVPLHHCTEVQDWERFCSQKLGLTPMYSVGA